eukprot:350491-Chlamydomonas_euryale.AAC.5
MMYEQKWPLFSPKRMHTYPNLKQRSVSIAWHPLPSRSRPTAPQLVSVEPHAAVEHHFTTRSTNHFTIQAPHLGVEPHAAV